MVDKNITKMLLLAFVLLFTTETLAKRGKNPCHANRSVHVLGVDCEHIRMPPKLCKACKIRSYGEDGLFDDCEAIYDIEDASCTAELDYYVSLNTCDTVRAAQMKDLSNLENRRAIDYFVYSICEQCCDCIPKGARSEQFGERKKTRTLLSFVRGNCVAHAHYDVCRVWPEIRHLTGPKGKPKVDKFVKACPEIKKWSESDEFKDWYKRDVVISEEVVGFLKNLNRNVKCANRKIWNACVGLERAQKRI